MVRVCRGIRGYAHEAGRPSGIIQEAPWTAAPVRRAGGPEPAGGQDTGSPQAPRPRRFRSSGEGHGAMGCLVSGLVQMPQVFQENENSLQS